LYFFRWKNLFYFIYREKQKNSRTLRTAEKRLRDALSASDEAQKKVDTYKDQVRISSKIFN
jgi:hypothetical protein